MTEFAETAMRKMCRNPRCGSKLPEPVSNPREAFCTKGCYSQFYRTHCLVCEAAIEQPKRGERLICRKAACIKAESARGHSVLLVRTLGVRRAGGHAVPRRPTNQLVGLTCVARRLFGQIAELGSNP